MDKKIFVIVPVYKVEPYLHQCVDSILDQTYRDFELILVDDGSPDNCPAICDEYAKKDNRVTVIHKANGGLSSARNAGLDYIKNKPDGYVTFIDSDDWVTDNYLETLKSMMESDNTDISMVISFSEPIDIGFPSKDQQSLLLHNTDIIQLNQKNFEGVYYSTAWGKMYEKSLFDLQRGGLDLTRNALLKTNVFLMTST